MIKTIKTKFCLFFTVQAQTTSLEVLKIVKREIFNSDQDVDTSGWLQEMKNS